MTPYYEQDGITIYHGDAYQILGEIVPILDCVTTLLTDPMYGNRTNIKGATSGRASSRRLNGLLVQPKDWDLSARDDVPFDPALFLHFPEVVLWGGNHYSSRLPDAACWIVWDKRDGGSSDDNADCELAWTNLRGPARLLRHLWRGVMRAGEENIAVAGAKLHPFQKPLELMRFCLSLSKKQGVVFDPFMGSGTTLVAAKQMHRRAVGIEIEECYCEVAAKRLSQGVLPLELCA